MILITLMGIIAFISIILSKRTKEIAIRRIHGASTNRLILMLLKDFVWEFVLSTVVATAIAVYFLSDWLTGFQFRIDLNAYPFLLVQLSIFIVISIVIGAYSLRTIRKNSATVLRSE
jgi:ABC-type antimicrobial peptide transport system permease subunit